MNTMSKIKIISCIPALLFLLFGICYFFFGQRIPLNFVYTFLCAVFILYGVIKFFCYFSKDMYQLAFQFDFAMGIFYLVTGFLFYCFQREVQNNFLSIIGFTVFIDAVLKIQTSLEAKRFGMDKWWTILILAGLTALAALLFVVPPMERLQRYGLIYIFNFMYAMGLIFFLEGFLNLWVVLYTVKEIP